jgi:Fuc2NAc and GlcNAc transferase
VTIQDLSILFVLVCVASALISWLLVRRGGVAVDLPNSRSSHSIPTPRGGGLAFFLPFAIAITAFYAMDGGFVSELPPIFFLCWVLIFILGLCEDKFQLAPKIRLGIQAGLAAILVWNGYYWGVLEQFGLIVPYSDWIDKSATVILIVWVVNLYNFMDGINGIATLQGIVVAGLYLGLGIGLNCQAYVIVGTITLAALVGFLPFNFPKAKIFMGDSGSLFLGFLVITLPLVNKVTRSYDATFAIVAIAPFFFDALITIVRRLINRENILKPHRSHFYQKLQMIGQSHANVALLYFLWAATAATIAFLRFRNEGVYNYAAIGLILGLAVFFFAIDKSYRKWLKASGIH